MPTRTQLLDAARTLCQAAWARPDLETSKALATWQGWSLPH
ncbi:hypothetical protein [Nocardia salmonicida]